MKYICLLLLILIVSIGCNPRVVKNSLSDKETPDTITDNAINGLRFSINSPKNKYVLYEKITIQYVIENVTNKPIVISRYSDSGAEHLTRDNNLGGIRHGDRIGEVPKENDFVTINKGDPFITEMDYSSRCSNAGSYILSLSRTYRQTGKEYGLAAWVGEVTTNTITFVVAEK